MFIYNNGARWDNFLKQLQTNCISFYFYYLIFTELLISAEFSLKWENPSYLWLLSHPAGYEDINLPEYLTKQTFFGIHNNKAVTAVTTLIQYSEHVTE